MEDKENAIIIHGVKHVLVNDKDWECTDCSLANLCNNTLCLHMFKQSHKHFEIKED